MKHLRPCVVGLLLAALLVGPLLAATPVESSVAKDKSPGAAVAASVAAVTGIAISPLLATAAYGAYQYYQTPPLARDQLPWFAQFGFWCPALVLVGLVAAKDTLGAVLPPGWKQPLDVLETVENKVSGIIAAGAVIPVTVLSLFGPGGMDTASQPFAAAGLATLGTFEGATMVHWATIPFALAVYAMVWVASHAINVLILMSPWGGIDAVLKLARLLVLASVGITAWIHPWLGAAFSLVVIVAAYFVAGRAFRLTIFGSLFVWDFLSRKRERFHVRGQGDLVFTAGRLAGVPARTMGRMVAGPEGLRLAYRRWWRGAAREVTLPPAHDIWVGRGMFFSNLQSERGPLLLLLPRYEGHEAELVRAYGLAGVREAGLRRAWSWLREALVGEAPLARPVA